MDGFGADARFAGIAEFSELITAEFYQSLLLENGIQAFVHGADAHALQVPGLSRAFGLSRGIRLCVPTELAEEARCVLEEFDQRPSADAGVEDEDAEPDDADFDEGQGDADWDMTEEDYEEEMLTEGDDNFEERREDIVPDGDLFDESFDDTASDAGDTGGLALLFKWLLIAVIGMLLFRLSLSLF